MRYVSTTTHCQAVLADRTNWQLIYRMDNISKWSCTNEPGVQKYALVIPREDDNVTAWSIEQSVPRTAARLLSELAGMVMPD